MGVEARRQVYLSEVTAFLQHLFEHPHVGLWNFTERNMNIGSREREGKDREERHEEREE